MNPTEMERRLMTEEGRKAILERAKDLKDRYGDLICASPSERRRCAGPEVQPSEDEERSNNEDYEVRSPVSAELSFLVEGMEDWAPKRVLSKLCKLGERNEGSRTYLLLIDSAINRFLSLPHLTQEDEEAVSKALEALHKLDRPKERSEEGVR